MFVHIVAWKYNSETSEETREEHRKRLLALREVIPEILDFEVGADILSLDRSYDTGLFARYADRDAFDAYTNHPMHLEVAAMGKEIAKHVISVDFYSDQNLPR
ncbi:MAG: Dabb family protein [Pyrinomonadaceae bacterium]